MVDEARPTLEALGYDGFFARALAELGQSGLEPARVLRADRGMLRLGTGAGEADVRLPRRLRREGISVAVGDWVAIESSAAGHASLAAVLPRRTVFVRRAAGRSIRAQTLAANFDTLFLMTSLDGDFNPRRLERYLTLAGQSGAAPVILLNKVDLSDDAEALRVEAAAHAGAAPVVLMSAKHGVGIEALTCHLAPRTTVALLGSSGVGKSTLVNWLVGSERMRTAEVRTRDRRGQHTTSHRELILLPGGALLIDSPGLRELGLWGDEETVERAFEDIERLAQDCHFSDCHHAGEPDCAVRRAIDDGSLPDKRLSSYLKLRHEMQDQAARRREQERQADYRRQGDLACRLKRGGR